MAEATLVGLLPLKITGRHYGHNIGRCDILFRTLELQKGFDLIDELVIVVPDDELAVIRDVARRWERYRSGSCPSYRKYPNSLRSRSRIRFVRGNGSRSSSCNWHPRSDVHSFWCSIPT